MDSINIWDLKRVHIKLKNSFLEKINQEISLRFRTKKNFYNKAIKNREIPWMTFKNILKPSVMSNFFVPLNIYLKIIKNLDFSKNTLQKNVISYKTGRGRNYIKKPILPIKLTPLFDMLFAHHIADGTVINPGKGRLPYFGYRQFDKLYRIQYIRLIEGLFGKLKFRENYFNKSTRPYCPPVLSSAFFKYYGLGVRDFLSRTARIPKKLFSKDKEYAFAVLLAFIIDEAHIDSTQITVSLKNKLLVDDLDKLCKILDYKSKVTYRKTELYKDYATLNILREGMRKLYKDYKLFKQKYLMVDFGIKGEKIEKSFKINNRDIIRIKGNKKIITKLLEKNQFTVNQIADRINMTRQGVRYHIHNLIKENKVRLINNTSANWVYGV